MLDAKFCRLQPDAPASFKPSSVGGLVDLRAAPEQPGPAKPTHNLAGVQPDSCGQAVNDGNCDAVAAIAHTLQASSRLALVLTVALAVLLVCYVSMRIADAVRPVADGPALPAGLIAYRVTVIAIEVIYGVCAVRYTKMAAGHWQEQSRGGSRGGGWSTRKPAAPRFVLVVLSARSALAADVAAAAAQHAASAQAAGLAAHVAVVCTAQNGAHSAVQSALSVLNVPYTVHAYDPPAGEADSGAHAARTHRAALAECLQRLMAERAVQRALVCIAAASVTVSATDYRHAKRAMKHRRPSLPSPQSLQAGASVALDMCDVQHMQRVLVRPGRLYNFNF